MVTKIHMSFLMLVIITVSFLGKKCFQCCAGNRTLKTKKRKMRADAFLTEPLLDSLDDTDYNSNGSYNREPRSESSDTVPISDQIVKTIATPEMRIRLGLLIFGVTLYHTSQFLLLYT